MDGAKICPAHVTDCHIVSRSHPRVLRRKLGSHPKGTAVQAFFQRAPGGDWRVAIMVASENSAWMGLIEQSSWESTREQAERWLDYRTRVPAQVASKKSGRTRRPRRST